MPDKNPNLHYSRNWPPALWYAITECLHRDVPLLRIAPVVGLSHQALRMRLTRDNSPDKSPALRDALRAYDNFLLRREQRSELQAVQLAKLADLVAELAPLDMVK